jgi:succinate dehydrogenase/fumarate reductase cytochrome b subunit
MTSFPAFKQAHRLSAIGLGLFIALHLCVHLSTLGGADLHLKLLKTVQGVYRNPIVEPMLLLAILVQVVSGVTILLRKWRMPNKQIWTWVQIVSGVALIWLMIQHTSAALLTRYGLGLETNFYWVAGPIQNPTFRHSFIVYYFLLVFAVFAHMAALVYFKRKQDQLASSMVLGVGATVASLIVAALAGAFYPIHIPPEYAAVYAAAARGEIPTRATTH